MPFNFSLSLLTAALLIVTGVAGAETETDSTIHTLDKVVVSASATEQKILELPVHASVMDQNQLDGTPAKNVEELFSALSSVQVNRMGGISEGLPLDISLRGIPGALAAQRVLVLVDGVASNVAGTPFLVLNEIPVGLVQSVEVVRGPYSSLYGANAFAGVINIRTRPPSVGKLLDISSEFGLGGYTGTELVSGWGTETLQAQMHIGMRSIDNVFVENDPDANRDYADFRSGAQLRYKATENITAEFFGRYFTANLGDGYALNSYPALQDSLENSIASNKFIGGLRLNWQATERLRLQSMAHHRAVWGVRKHEQIDSIFPGTSPLGAGGYARWQPGSAETRTNDQFASLSAHYSASALLNLTVGIDQLRNEVFIDSVRYRPHTSNPLPNTAMADTAVMSSGLFLHNEFYLGQKVLLSGSVRLDYHGFFGLIPSAKSGIWVEVLPDLHLRGSVASAWRAPSLSELFLPRTQLNSFTQLVASPALEPERILGFDGGFDYTHAFGEDEQIALIWRTSLFRNQLYDLINPVLSENFFSEIAASANSIISLENASQATSQGIELEMEFLLNSLGSLWASYTWIDSRDHASGSQLDYIPANSFSFGITPRYTTETLALSSGFTLRYIGKRSFTDWFKQIDLSSNVYDSDAAWYVDPQTPSNTRPNPSGIEGYVAMDVQLNLQITPLNLTLGAVVQNLTNTRFVERGNRAGPLRLPSIYARWQWE